MTSRMIIFTGAALVAAIGLSGCSSVKSNSGGSVPGTPGVSRTLMVGADKTIASTVPTDIDTGSLLTELIGKVTAGG